MNFTFEPVFIWTNISTHVFNKWFILYGPYYNFYDTDRIWLQWWSKLGPNMNANFIEKETKYDCNVNFESDHKWLQSFPIGTKYDCNIEIHPKVTWLWFLDESRENKFSIIAIILSPNWERLQSYMIRFGIDIALIFGPLLWRLHSY